MESILPRFYNIDMITGAERPEEGSKIRETHMKAFGAETVKYHAVFIETFKIFQDL